MPLSLHCLGRACFRNAFFLQEAFLDHVSSLGWGLSSGAHNPGHASIKTLISLWCSWFCRAWEHPGDRCGIPYIWEFPPLAQTRVREDLPPSWLDCLDSRQLQEVLDFQIRAFFWGPGGNGGPCFQGL